jgi:hypothetical protein
MTNYLSDCMRRASRLKHARPCAKVGGLVQDYADRLQDFAGVQGEVWGITQCQAIINATRPNLVSVRIMTGHHVFIFRPRAIMTLPYLDREKLRECQWLAAT